MEGQSQEYAGKLTKSLDQILRIMTAFGAVCPLMSECYLVPAVSTFQNTDRGSCEPVVQVAQIRESRGI